MTVVGAEVAVPALAAMPSISLADLVVQAPLHTRIERKYVVPVEVADAVVASLGRGDARVLETNQRSSFAYESRYYDTPTLTSYLMAAHRRRRRFKVRRRTYLDSQTAYLEVKTRGIRGTTVKERMRYPHEGVLLNDEGQAFVDTHLQRAGISSASASELRPTLCTSYLRSTLLLPSAHCRVTIDTDLQWSLRQDRGFDLSTHAIIETKSPRAVSVADRLLWAKGHRPCRISKYGTGLALLRPELPSNRWHSVLHRHLRPTP